MLVHLQLQTISLVRHIPSKGISKDSDKSAVGKKRKEKYTLFSDHNGSLFRRQPGAISCGCLVKHNLSDT